MRKRHPDSSDQDEKDDFSTLYVIVFSPKAKQKTVDWLLGLMQQRKCEGGAELLVRATPKSGGKGVIAEVSASISHLIQTAELMEFKKEDKNGILREFTLANIDKFIGNGGGTLDELLTTSEMQRIVFEELENMQLSEKKPLIEYPDIKLYPGQSIVQVLKNNGIITQVFPIHDHEELERLEKKWFNFSFLYQPVDDIKHYFGGAIAFYFAFASYYTIALLPPAIIGIIQACTIQTHTIFAVFDLLWVTVFLEGWKRKSNALAYKWGTLGAVTLPKMHPTFRGKSLGIDPVTGKQVPFASAYRRYFRVYFVSTPIIMLCLFGAFCVMLLYFEAEKHVIQALQDEPTMYKDLLIQLPGVTYAILVIIMNSLYRPLANFLTEWENHKTQTSFENYRIVKLILFEFANNFLSLLYVAFYMQNIEMLKRQIAMMLIAYQLFHVFQEAILPVFLLKHKQYRKKKERAKLLADSGQTLQAFEECDMLPYEGTYDDYLELFIQFGYVFLFSSVFPWAAILAFLGNILEISSDAFKLSRAFQRPPAKPTKGIGVWQVAFEVLGVVAVMTNCALLSMSPDVRALAPEISPIEWVLVAVAAEHVLITIKVMMAYLIPDVPKWITVNIQKAHYQTFQAVKSERKMSVRTALKRFHTEDGLPKEKDHTKSD